MSATPPRAPPTVTDLNDVLMTDLDVTISMAADINNSGAILARANDAAEGNVWVILDPSFDFRYLLFKVPPFHQFAYPGLA